MAGRRLDFNVFIRIWGRVRLETWQYQAEDPHHTFHITLGRFPEGCEYGAWWVDATREQRETLVFDTEEEARAGLHDEALRIQRLGSRGRWLQVDPN